MKTGFFLKPLSIIDNFNLTISKGCSTGLIGTNGAGKTTILKLAAGLIRPNSGSILINKKSVQQPSTRSSIGLLTETQYFYPHLKITEWLQMLGYLSGLKTDKIKKRIDIVLDMFDLFDIANSYLSTLSKGQKQRAGLAQAFLHEPEVLLLDEPMSGLDPLWRSKIQNILLEYKKQQGTILFSSHIISDVMRLADQIVVIKSGKINWQGNMQALSSDKCKYQAVFDTNEPDEISLSMTSQIERQPDNSYLITFSADKKTKFIELMCEGKIKIHSITPLYSKIEELFL